MNRPETRIYIPQQIRENYFIFSNGYFVKKEDIFNELQNPCKGDIFYKDVNVVNIKISLNHNIAVYGYIENTSLENGTVYNAVLNEIRLNYGVQIEGRIYHIISIIDGEFSPIYGKVRFLQENVKKGNTITRESWVTWLGTENPE